ncbi:MAG: DMT family transporter [candidate division Zixibacteria bacterium]|nr:DMT family transporter [candidate division Zixibacteria bacterium]
MDFINNYLGQSLALLTAVTWAFAVILFKKSGEMVHPIGLNLFKNTLAVILLIPTVWLFGETLFYPASTSDYLLILASGALGIGISDTLFFMSLNTLGAGLIAIVDCLYSPFIILLSFLWLGEVLDIWQVIGVMMIVSAVLTATGEKNNGPVERRQIFLGLFYGVTAMVVMAVGIVMIKPVLDRSPLFWITTVRLIGGALVLLIILTFHPGRKKILGSIGAPNSWGYTLSGSFTGAYLAMVLWLAGMKFTQASIASALNQMSNVFIFIFAALLLREKLTLFRVIGIILGFGGTLLVTFG